MRTENQNTCQCFEAIPKRGAGTRSCLSLAELNAVGGIPGVNDYAPSGTLRLQAQWELNLSEAGNCMLAFQAVVVLPVG